MAPAMGSTLRLGGCVRLTIAARQSHLARHQALEVGEALQRKHPHLQIQYHFRESLGDKNLQDPLWKMPEKGVFTEDFNSGLLNSEFDLVVHSWKDLPVEPREGTELIASLPRADQRDLLLVKKSIFKRNNPSQTLVLFSSSPRRIYNLSQLIPKLWPHPLQNIEFQSVRGNIPTRIRKMLESPTADGLILAKAALDRLMSPRTGEEWEQLRSQLRTFLEECDWMVLPLIDNPTAAAQGAIVVESKKGRTDLKELFQGVHCEETFKAVSDEREALKAFGGGCHLALGISSIVRKNKHFLITKGQTPQGEKFSEIRSTYKGPKFLSSEVMVIKEEPVRRETLPVNTDLLKKATGLLISRKESWPEGYQPSQGQILWTAGLKTWQKMAAKGVWIHGTSESLGLETPSLEFLELKKKMDSPFLKLTHQEVSRGAFDVPIYKLHESELLKLEPNIKIFFWKSGKLAERYFKQNPWLTNCYHACGLGDSEITLKRLLSSHLEHLHLFLNEQDFKNAVIAK